MCKELISDVYSVSVSVGVGEALSIKPTSPFFDPEKHKKGDMITAYTVFKGWTEEPEPFLVIAKKETGLDIQSYDTHYCLQFDINTRGTPDLKKIQSKLKAFVAKHFVEWKP